MVRLNRDYDKEGEVLKQLHKAVGDIEKKEELLVQKQYRSIEDRYAPSSCSDEETVENDSDGCDEVKLKKQILCEGDRTLQSIFFYLDKVYRSPQQKLFHMMFTSSILRQIYKGDDFVKHRHRVMAEYGFESFKQLVLLCCPRRFGKTFSVAIWSLVVAICVPGTVLSVFSAGRRQSVSLLSTIYGYVRKMGEDDRVIRKNEEKMIIRCLDGSENVINAYPSQVRTLKGVAGSILVLEEMAVIDEQVLYEVITPLLQIDQACMIGISTITTEFNFMTRYLVMKDQNDELLFHSRHFYLACDDCMKAGKAASCSHNSYLLPAWSSARKRKIINALMSDQEALLNREIGGMASSVNSRAFSAAMVDKFFARPAYEVDQTAYYHQIFIAVDPNACGANSDIAITSMLRYEGRFIIIGMESFPSMSANENHELLLKHVAKLESLPYFMNSKKVFILESNLGLESEHIANMLSRKGLSNYLVMKQDPARERVGFLTTNSMKMLSVELLREKLVEGTLRMVSEAKLVCESQHPSKVIQTLHKQMCDFQEIVKDKEAGKPTRIFSGKSAGKDDLIMALLLNLHWSGFFFNCSHYAHHLKY